MSLLTSSLEILTLSSFSSSLGTKPGPTRLYLFLRVNIVIDDLLNLISDQSIYLCFKKFVTHFLFFSALGLFPHNLGFTVP